MKFRNFQLIIDRNYPTSEDLNHIVAFGLSCDKKYGDDWYTVTREFIENRFLWLYCQHENATIYNDVVSQL